MKIQLTSAWLLSAMPLGFGFTISRSFTEAAQQSSFPLNMSPQDQEGGHSLTSSLPTRRNFLVAGALISQGLLLPADIAMADGDGDLTSQLFNPDGSLKSGEAEEAKFRTVEIAWDKSTSEKYFTNVDGKNSAGTESGSGVKLTYKIPEKWEQKDAGYFDKSTTEFAKACERITVYRVPGTIKPERLDKAATIGVGEALYVTEELQALKGADLISGRSRKQGDIKFYDFDMAVAPKTCGDSKDNLGLGFCPFDSIYLLSAAVFDDAMYVMALECGKAEWKVANSDLKRVRSSFGFEM